MRNQGRSPELPAGTLTVILKVYGKEAASGVVPVGAPLGLTANDRLDFGVALGLAADLLGQAA